MNAASLALFRLRLLCVAHLISLIHFTLGGTCWSAMVSRPSSAMSAAAAAAASSANSHHPHHHHGGPFSMTSSSSSSASSKGEPPHGRCTELLQERVSREQCCASPSHTTAYSDEELDSGTLFFWRVLGGGVKCMPCKNSCTGVVCPADRKCSMRAGAPKCVCTSKCERPPKGRRGRRGSSKGPVCGTDGRTYRDACRLRKNACRKRKQGRLEVAYEGHCQQSCSRIQCPMGKHCLLDQNLRPHCAACLRRCPTFADGGTKRAVCAVDGRTYPSACHLRAAACTAGRAVPIAYRGPCKANATCSTIRCRPGERCLRDAVRGGSPRCAHCSPAACRARHWRGPAGGAVCGTDRVTYASWCHMQQAACRKGLVLETRHAGQCTAKKLPPTAKGQGTHEEESNGT